MLAKVHLYQILVTVIAAIMIYQGVDSYIKGKYHATFLKLLVRLVVWGGMVIVAITPNFTNKMAEILGLEGNINAVVLTGFILIFLILFKFLSAIERIEQNITEITREKSLKNLKKEE